jgi:O-methyltransferase
MLKSLLKPVWRSTLRPALDRFMRIDSCRNRVENLGYRSRFLAWTEKFQPEKRIEGGYERRLELHEYVFEREQLTGPILYLEFGVFQGESLRWWLAHNRHPESRFVGFDSFEGLPEDWRDGREKGAFAVGGKPPEIDDSRCSFEVGWFNNTVMTFVQKQSFDKRLVLHLDADLYSSTLLVLFALADKLRANDILIFDEFCDVRQEFRAWIDFLSAYPRKYEVLGMVGNFGKVAIKLLD